MSRNPFYGSGMNTHQNTNVTLSLRPHQVRVPQADLDDLQGRLKRTRYSAPTPGDDSWDLGTPTDYLTTMVEHWATNFDWREVEDLANVHPQFLTEINGQTIHFLHIRSPHQDATALLLTHTYPGSFLDFLDLIEPLTNPTEHGGIAGDAFHLVIPSLPGTGFSTPLVDGDWTMAKVADTWDTLMRGLGYNSYGAHGSDTGAMVSRELAIANPTGFLGAHVLQLFSFPSGDPAEFEDMTPDDYAALEFAGWFQSVNGFAQMNAARPQTIAAALSDSPVGQLAYNELFENFGNGTGALTRDQVLAQVSLCWLTNTSAGAGRYYYTEKAVEPRINPNPIGVTVFADDFQSIRPFAHRDNTNIVSWTTQPQGGHYAAIEVPNALASELRAFYTTTTKA